MGTGDIGTATVCAVAPAQLARTSGEVSSGALSAWLRGPVQVGHLGNCLLCIKHQGREPLTAAPPLMSLNPLPVSTKHELLPLSCSLGLPGRQASWRACSRAGPHLASSKGLWPLDVCVAWAGPSVSWEDTNQAL